MFRVLIYLLIIAALAIGAVWLADRPGEVTMLWQGYRIETSVAIAAIGVVALAFLVMLAWSIIRFVFGLPGAFGLSSKARRRARGFSALSRGMVAVGAGDAVSAQRYATEARKFAADEPLSLLLDAQAAQMAGDREAAATSFNAMLDRSETRVLGLRGLFMEARRRGDADAAQRYADEAVKLSPSIAWANDALLQFHSSTGDWPAARTAVERRAALKLADKDEAKRQRAVLLTAEALEKRQNQPEASLSVALEAVKLAPGLSPAAALAGELLSARGDARKASKLLEAAWRQSTHPDLAKAYLNIRASDTPEGRLQRAETLSNLKPSDPESALTVASAAIAAKAFDKARKALAPLMASAPTVRACSLMAELEDAEHGGSGRAREWLSRAMRAHRDPAWVADGIVSAHWLPASPVTGALDAFVWTTPPAALGADGPILDDLGPLPETAVPRMEIPARPVVAPMIEADMPAGAASRIADEMMSTAPIMADAPPKAVIPPVVFPVAHAPDDPGPDAAMAEPAPRKRFRLFG
jgi:HemY protein